MTETTRIEGLIAPALEAMGFGIVRVRMMGADGGTLQIMAEPLAERQMTVDDCADISRAVSALLDVEDPITGSYVLEVSSPGLDRPLVKIEDFERFAGYQAKLELGVLREGRKRFRGRLLGAEAGTVRIIVPDEGEERVFKLPYVDIVTAKLTPGDDVISAALQSRQRH
ncbi:MAG TPA: ribosome maturation factor RimP [Alphaproteobacteria bacterium]|nr:ribosome maturation factor RimP [Alphaproteobacteria bacterium]MDP7164198.1 ribosome maturation factor RimP [Alphaproteobacteria bacterium]MDP7426738.1 ribosome maturation factor RimP [Alphaproteobacteria bacterium]HJM49960.1 ribosome maturation factor RimP [Alphaproteobacteria bacterium]